MLAFSLVGCATQDYELYAKAQSEVAVAKHNSDAAKYKAMGDIAASGTEAAKVAAVMALALGQSTSTSSTLQAPQQSSALQWAQVLVPGVTQMVGIVSNTRLGMTQSDNSTKLGMSTNESFVGIASKIQAAPTITTTTDSHNTDNHTVTPTPVVVNQPVVVAPGTKVCTVSPTNVLTCE